MTQDIDEFIGVYDADATLVGEISYWIGARLGTAHCSLCELTHGLFTKKSEWKACAAKLPVPFLTYHRNDAPADVIALAAGRYPVVMARSQGELRIVLDEADLEDFGGNTASFTSWLDSQVSRN